MLLMMWDNVDSLNANLLVDRPKGVGRGPGGGSLSSPCGVAGIPNHRQKNKSAL